MDIFHEMRDCSQLLFLTLCVLLLAASHTSCSVPTRSAKSSLFSGWSPDNFGNEGTVEVEGAELKPRWKGRNGVALTDFDRIISAKKLKEKDFPGWVTQSGIGEPGLLYRSKKKNERFVSTLGTALPVTLVRKENSIYVCDVLDSDSFEGQKLAANFTAPFAYLRQQGNLRLPVIKAMLRSGDFLDETGLFRFEPVDPGRIPIIFVHGLKSSPSIWKIMVNELRRDPEIRKHFQFWSFSYPTGLPILYSAKLLRDDLNAIQETFNPGSVHPTWHRMVLVGHSMGGLISRLQVTESKSTFWDHSTLKQAGLQLNDVSDRRVRETLIFHPLPYVERVVFMATPHGGSDVAVSRMGQITSSLIQIPSDITETITDIVLRKDSRIGSKFVNIPTSIDNLKPDSSFIRNLSSLPVDPRITYHSIIASGGVANVHPENIDDGLVKYKSASIKGAKSEKIVPSGHRAPNHPEAVAEVARILHVHLSRTE